MCARSNIDKIDWKKTPLLFPEHHLSHAASAFYPSPFEDAAILTLDGVGEWTTTSVCHGKGNKIEIKEEIRFPHSLGLLYSAFTYFLGLTYMEIKTKSNRIKKTLSNIEFERVFLLVIQQGFEPWTHALKGRCSTN